MGKGAISSEVSVIVMYGVVLKIGIIDIAEGNTKKKQRPTNILELYLSFKPIIFYQNFYI